MAENANKLKTNRGLFKTILLTIVTLGIYQLYLRHAWAKETNIACNGDGKKTTGLLLLCLFGILTLGIYVIVWHWKFANRTEAFLKANGKSARISGLGWFLWSWLGAMIVVGPLIALYRLIHQANDVNEIYNAQLEAAASATAEEAAPATEEAPAPAEEEAPAAEEAPAEAPSADEE